MKKRILKRETNILSGTEEFTEENLLGRAIRLLLSNSQKKKKDWRETAIMKKQTIFVGD